MYVTSLYVKIFIVIVYFPLCILYIHRAHPCLLFLFIISFIVTFSTLLSYCFLSPLVNKSFLRCLFADVIIFCCRIHSSFLRVRLYKIFPRLVCRTLLLMETTCKQQFILRVHLAHDSVNSLQIALHTLTLQT